MKPLLMILLVLFTFIMPLRGETIKADVNGIVCAFCVQGIESNFKNVKQAKDVYVDLDHKMVLVEFANKESSISDEEFKDIVKEAGFEVVKIERTGNSIKEIKKSLKIK